MLRMDHPKKSKRGPRLRYRRRRRRLGVLAVLLAIILGFLFFLNYSSGGALGIGAYFSGAPDETGEGSRDAGGGFLAGTPEEQAPRGPSKEELMGRPEESPEAAAYRALALELPGTEPGSVEGVYRSALDPSWASVRVQPSGEDAPYLVFAHEEGGEWRAETSIRVDEPEHPENETVVLEGGPEDLGASV